MSIREQHRFVFTGEEIAAAAERRAAEIGAQIDMTALEALKEELHAAIEARLVMIESGWYPEPVKQGEQTMMFGIDADLYQRFVYAARTLRDTQKLRDSLDAAARRYGSQGDREFDLAADDVAHFGLDQEGTP
jgi:hypothetical protein